MQITETFEKLTNLQRILIMAILAIIIYVASTSISYTFFSRFGQAAIGELASSLPGPATAVDEDPNEPKTEPCPLNGALRTKKAKASWERRRPLAVMIENHSEARPQSGLSSADIVYEAVAEGGITRFMAIFYCNLSDIHVGPIRSARTYFLDWLGEYDGLYTHVGGANAPGSADALSQIIKYGVKDLNQFSIGFPVFWRDYQRLGHPVATEHTMYSTTQKLWETGAKKGWTDVDEDKKSWEKDFTQWKFKDDQATGGTTYIKVPFWENQGAYTVEWYWDKASNSYYRKNGGENHMDLDNNRQLMAKNVIVQFQVESNANDGYPGNIHLLYKTTGKGKALIFQDGKVIEGNWFKATRVARTKFTDSAGKEVQFNKGQIWIHTVPEGSKVSN